MSLEQIIGQKIQNDVFKLLDKIKRLEEENNSLKNKSGYDKIRDLFKKNFLTLEGKYQRQFKKYMKCLFKYGMYQSSMSHLVADYNKLVSTIEKLVLKESQFQRAISQAGLNESLKQVSTNQYLEKYGLVYENNYPVGEEQMEKIIQVRLKKEHEENINIFFSGLQSGRIQSKVNNNIDRRKQFEQYNPTAQSLDRAIDKSLERIMCDKLLNHKIENKAQDLLDVEKQSQMEYAKESVNSQKQKTFESSDQENQESRQEEQTIKQNEKTMNPIQNQYVRVNQEKRQFEFINVDELSDKNRIQAPQNILSIRGLLSQRQSSRQQFNDDKILIQRTSQEFSEQIGKIQQVSQNQELEPVHQNFLNNEIKPLDIPKLKLTKENNKLSNRHEYFNHIDKENQNVNQSWKDESRIKPFKQSDFNEESQKIRQQNVSSVRTSQEVTETNIGRKKIDEVQENSYFNVFLQNVPRRVQSVHYVRTIQGKSNSLAELVKQDDSIIRGKNLHLSNMDELRQCSQNNISQLTDDGDKPSRRRSRAERIGIK